MGTLNEKLEYLSQTKEYIKEAIISKGQPVSSSDTFRSYASKIAAIENGDVITATNTTGSAVSADDRVWVSPTSIEIQNFTVVGNPTINEKTISNFSDSNYITTGLTQFAPTVSEPWEISISFTTGSNVTGANRTLIESNGFRVGIDYEGHAEIGLSDGTNGDNLTLSSVVLSSNTTYSLVAMLDNGDLHLALFPAEGGLPIASSNKTTSLTSSIVSSSVVFGVAYFYALYGVGQSNVFDGAIDLRHFYFVIMDPITYDTTFEWNPYSESSYSIIPSAQVTSTSFTGIAQEAIANNATGSIKTLLDGNGTYAPTLGTKVITRNNTYSASTDDLYGYSSVTVNVEDIPAVVESLSITPTTSAQSFTPTSGVDGYSPVTVSAVDSSIDANILAGNIKKDVQILGVTGSYEGASINNQNKSITVDGSYTADAGYTGLGTVTVTAGAVASAATQNEIAEELMLVNDGAVTFTLTVSPTDATSVITSTTNSVILTPSSSSGGVSIYSISANSLKTYSYSVSKEGYVTSTGTINGGTASLTVTLVAESQGGGGLPEEGGMFDPSDGSDEAL